MQNVHMQIAIIIDCRLGIALSLVRTISIYRCYFIEKHLNHKIQFTMLSYRLEMRIKFCGEWQMLMRYNALHNLFGKLQL